MLWKNVNVADATQKNVHVNVVRRIKCQNQTKEAITADNSKGENHVSTYCEACKCDPCDCGWGS
jgi:hypothetical protein